MSLAIVNGLAEQNKAKCVTKFKKKQSLFIIFCYFYRFFTRYGMPGVIGVVDGTHFYIKRPENDVEYVYYSVRKAAHTKNVQIVRYFKT